MKKSLLTIGAIGLLAIGSAQAATVLGISFNANTDRQGVAVGSGETAGAMAQQNWNNAGTLTDATDDGLGHVTFSNNTSGVNLVDSAGTAYSTIKYTITGGYPGGDSATPYSLWKGPAPTGGTTGDQQLMKGAFQTANYNTGTISLTNIDSFTGGTYDLYVYFTPRDNPPEPGYNLDTLTINGGSSYTIVATAFTGTYVQGNGTGGTGNYLKISGLTGASLTLTSVGQDFTTGITGIQIANVPEPATWALLGLGGAGVLIFRRHKR